MSPGLSADQFRNCGQSHLDRIVERLFFWLLPTTTGRRQCSALSPDTWFKLVPAQTADAQVERYGPESKTRLIIELSLGNACSIPVPHETTRQGDRITVALYEWEPTTNVVCALGGLRHGRYEVSLDDVGNGETIYINGKPAVDTGPG